MSRLPDVGINLVALDLGGCIHSLRLEVSIRDAHGLEDTRPAMN